MAYIDTKYLGKCETCRHHSDSGCKIWCDAGEGYSPNMFKIPTADVVEVVRCKECVFCVKADNLDNYICSATINPNYVPLDHFCSYGERKDKNG